MDQATIAAEERLLQALKELPPGEIKTTHHHDHGVYQRGLFVPAGTAVMGEVHRESGLLVLAKGDAIFYANGERQYIAAPWATVGLPGTRRAVYAVSDCYFISYVETDETDPDKIKAGVTAPSYNELEGPWHSPQLPQ